MDYTSFNAFYKSIQKTVQAAESATVDECIEHYDLKEKRLLESIEQQDAKMETVHRKLDYVLIESQNESKGQKMNKTRHASDHKSKSKDSIYVPSEGKNKPFACYLQPRH